jgi:hypothetical protein
MISRRVWLSFAAASILFWLTWLLAFHSEGFVFW